MEIRIRMLGEFSLTAGENTISDASTRSRKVWCLLAYLVCNRERTIPQKKLLDLLWGEAQGSNPENALRITLHRLRSLLDGLWPGAGHELISFRDGSCSWNPGIRVRLDCDEFEDLARCSGSEDDQLAAYRKALDLYRGEFLPKLASEVWVIPIAAHFQNHFLQLTMKTAKLLLARGENREAVQLCRRAAAAEAYYEPLYQLLMQALTAAGDPKGAAAVYERLSRRLYDDFGIHPNDQTRTVYRSIQAPGDRLLPMDEVMACLQEPPGKSGAMVCDYDHFKILCYAESRSLENGESSAYVALLSITSSAEQKPLSRRSANWVMEQLEEQLRQELRRSDIIARCSSSQFIVLLRDIDYENSTMVCRRSVASFQRTHPHTAVKIQYLIQPLHPGIRVP